jgi:hypothetical protein
MAYGRFTTTVAPGSTSMIIQQTGAPVALEETGWLNRLARGVFSRPGETLSLQPTLLLLERKIEGLDRCGPSEFPEPTPVSISRNNLYLLIS